MQRFASVLLLARLLAKFLGFLSFLPYQTSESPSGEIKEAAIALRNKVCLDKTDKNGWCFCADVTGVVTHCLSVSVRVFRSWMSVAC